ncbi:low-density lipoprotein receptor-related protein 6-like [Anneissia japonica]|uniref:low-density lipoprotein receptor-related protein 6-like n=1 Tax=Anneissia japonica TaxID=1529436 RepID=UPI00142591F1|nr:low-density lipoprotein receptor-related protein 6-like [Anneissia japonica]
MRELFNTDVIKPRSIAIDPFEKLLFWSELGPPGQIESSNLDGSNRNVINDVADQPSGLAVDLNEQRVYFADRNDGRIHYMNYDGSKLNTFYTHPENSYLNFFDITLYQDFIFWTESTDGDRNGIYVVSNENGNEILGNLPESSTIYSIETYDESVQPSNDSVCNQEGNNGCSRLCLTSLLNETSCACSDGFVIDDSDYTQCKPESSILQDDFYLIADQEKHSIFQMNAKEPFKYIGLNIGIVGDPVDITYDPIERRLYWVDAEFPAIRRSSLDGTNVESVIKDENIVSPMGVAVDYVIRLMFWTDSALRKIEVSYLDGTVRYSLITTGSEEPRDIVVDPIGSRIFWSVHGNNPAIRTAYMDGGSERKLPISELVSKPSGLVINFKEGRLYWCDETNGVIESINLDGTDSKMYIELPPPSQPRSATLRFDDVVWSDNMETSLRHVDSESGEASSIDDNHFGKMSSIHHHASISSLQVTDVDSNECLDDNGGCSHICLPGQVVGQVVCTYGYYT